MQTLRWYARRMRAMTPGEIAWRTRTALRDESEHLALAIGSSRPLRSHGGAGLLDGAPPFRLNRRDATGRDHGVTELRRRADALLEHRLRLHGTGECSLGETVDWNRDYEAQRRAPLAFAPKIDYRDYAAVGDPQLVWQLNRHQHLTVLAYAFHVTGQCEYAEGVARDLTSWLDQCPYRFGLNWRDPLEVAVRLINWVWTIDLVRDSGVLVPISGRLGEVIERHVAVIARNYARGSSGNNHRVGEAAGVFVACSYFPGLPKAMPRRAAARRVLLAEIERQVHPDGVSREQAFGYHLFVSELFEVAGIVARRAGDAFPPGARARVGAMHVFTRAARAGGGSLPRFGDDDDGHVLGDGLMACAPPPKAQPLASRAFTDSGHYLLQAGEGDDRVSVHFRCGAFGFGRLAAHAHADQLAFTLRVFGDDVLIDPGTYDYFRDPAWRRYFRSTAAHNTLTIDGADQAEMSGPFLWERHPEARVRAWEPAPSGGRVAGRHLGYTRLPQPVLHERSLTLDAQSSRLTIVDDLRGAGTHDVEFRLHVAEHCHVRKGADAWTFLIETRRATLLARLDGGLDVEVVRGRVAPIDGWVSRRYHEKVESDTLIGRIHTRGDATLRCTIEWNLRTVDKEPL